VLWVSWSKLSCFLDYYLPDYVIFDYLDDFTDWKPYMNSMAEKANLIVTPSSILQEQIKTQFPDKPNFLIPNGCDLDHFKPKEKTNRPYEFNVQNGPVIIYSERGAKWIDSGWSKK
jgi:glycosyltransferase involved in cell wall biosynthesis